METVNSYQQEMIGMLVEINRLLSEHIRLQNSILNKKADFRIPFLSKKTDFEALYESSKKIQSEIFKIIRQLQQAKKELNIDPFIYGGIKDYALLFHTSSEKLTQIAYERHLAAKKQNMMTSEEYARLVGEYQIIENSRMNKGTTIQKIATLLAQ